MHVLCAAVELMYFIPGAGLAWGCGVSWLNVCACVMCCCGANVLYTWGRVGMGLWCFMVECVCMCYVLLWS